MNYKHLESAVRKVNKLLTDHIGNDCLIRGFLTRGNQRNLDEENFIKIHNLLESCSKWRHVTDWSEIHCAFYNIKGSTELSPSHSETFEAMTRVTEGASSINIEHTAEVELGCLN